MAPPGLMLHPVLDLGPVRKDLQRHDRAEDPAPGFVVERAEVNPRPPRAKKLRGESELWRAHVGDYRILYTIEEARLVVLVIRIGHRREVYRGAQ